MATTYSIYEVYLETLLNPIGGGNRGARGAIGPLKFKGSP